MSLRQLFVGPVATHLHKLCPTVEVGMVAFRLANVLDDGFEVGKVTANLENFLQLDLVFHHVNVHVRVGGAEMTGIRRVGSVNSHG